MLWKTVTTLFPDKGPIREKITLTEKDEMLDNKKEIHDIFNNFFFCIVAKLNILKYEDLSVSNDNYPVRKHKNCRRIRSLLNKSPNISNSIQEEYGKENFKLKCSKSISRLRYTYKNN